MIFISGRWTEDELDKAIREASWITDEGERIGYISGLFLGIPYREATLIGGIDRDEELVIDLSGVDCFTFIDYVEAMRLSWTLSGFVDNLRRVRYQLGHVDYQERNHFFTDWREFNRETVRDVTGELGRDMSITVRKRLNMGAGGALLLPGIAVRERDITYIPSKAIAGETSVPSLLNGDVDGFLDKVIVRLKSGDYIGIYSGREDLDVSHVGIFIRTGEGNYLRHASSVAGRVVDEGFKGYVSRMDGFLILRPLRY